MINILHSSGCLNQQSRMIIFWESVILFSYVSFLIKIWCHHLKLTQKIYTHSFLLCICSTFTLFIWSHICTKFSFYKSILRSNIFLIFSWSPLNNHIFLVTNNLLYLLTLCRVTGVLIRLKKYVWILKRPSIKQSRIH